MDILWSTTLYLLSTWKMWKAESNSRATLDSLKILQQICKDSENYQILKDDKKSIP